MVRLSSLNSCNSSLGTEYSCIVARYKGDRGVRNLNCAQQFRAMAFAQLTGRRSLRDLSACLDAAPANRYLAGFTAPISFSSLARANERHPWHIYQALARHLIDRARPLYAEENLGLNLDDTVYALDSSTVDLCLLVFGWAPFRPPKLPSNSTLSWTYAARYSLSSMSRRGNCTMSRRWI